jgi:hypothetical protein
MAAVTLGWADSGDGESGAGARSATTSDRIGVGSPEHQPGGSSGGGLRQRTPSARGRMRLDGCVSIRRRRMNHRASGAESRTSIGAAMKGGWSDIGGGTGE